MNSEENIDLENSMAPWLGKTVKIIDCYLLEQFQLHNIDLTKEQMVVLKKLHITDGLNQNELAYLTYKDKSSLTRLLTKMEKKNYIFRAQSKEDKRVKNVYVTSLGSQVYKQSKPIIKKAIQKMEQSVSSEEKQQIIQILQKIQSNFCPSQDKQTN